MTRLNFTSWKTRLAASYNLLLEQSIFERPANRPVDQEHAPLSHADQLACTAGVVENAVADFDRVRECQRAAAQQLSAAEYALQELVAELVSAIPAVVAGTGPQTKPLADAEPIEAESEPVAAQEDDALAA
ncbi:MAG: hypothetical protein ACR2OF_04730 [Hyphomicrobium sp.]